MIFRSNEKIINNFGLISNKVDIPLLYLDSRFHLCSINQFELEQLKKRFHLENSFENENHLKIFEIELLKGN
jgi:hypothetical protein